MSFQIPKTLPHFNTLLYPDLLAVEMNDIDVDRMMSTLLEMFFKNGRSLKSNTKPLEYDVYLEQFLALPTIDGLDQQRRKEVINGWLRAAVIVMGKAGLDRAVPKMDYLKPISAGVFRAGLPRGSSRNRKADVLIYRSLVQAATSRAEETSDNKFRFLSALVERALCDGLDIPRVKEQDPKYNGHSQIDLSAILALEFIQEFPNRGAMTKRLEGLDTSASGDDVALGAVLGAVDPIGLDVLSLLEHYGGALSTPELVEHLTSVISFRLFQLPLRVAFATRSLLETGELDVEWGGGDIKNPLSIFCDFTREVGSISDDLSRRCVQRDLDRMRQFLSDRLVLRTLDRQVMPMLRDNAELRVLTVAERLRTLVQRMEDDEVEQAIHMNIQAIEYQLKESDDGSDGIALIDSVREAKLRAVDQIGQVLFEGLRKRGLENQVKWFWNAGGITKADGLLKGTLKARTTWRYAPSDHMLISILMVAFADQAGRKMSAMPIAELLIKLERSFGILIDKPPPEFENASTRAAAARNRDAFVMKLQLLGCFDASDTAR